MTSSETTEWSSRSYCFVTRPLFGPGIMSGERDLGQKRTNNANEASCSGAFGGLSIMSPHPAPRGRCTLPTFAWYFVSVLLMTGRDRLFAIDVYERGTQVALFAPA
ncbi:MAG: hypothetical protein N3G20_00595 [Verrucomicrobiae bacterium]|nr:hypothetical protein [Verrucomicrobiae bacterium]